MRSGRIYGAEGRAMPEALAAIRVPLLLALGVGLLGWAVRVAARARGRVEDPLGWFLAVARALRLGIVGLAVAAIGAGLWLDDRALVGLALVIGLEELYETTVVLALLRWARRSGWPEMPPPGLAKSPT